MPAADGAESREYLAEENRLLREALVRLQQEHQARLQEIRDKEAGLRRSLGIPESDAGVAGPLQPPPSSSRTPLRPHDSPPDGLVGESLTESALERAGSGVRRMLLSEPRGGLSPSKATTSSYSAQFRAHNGPLSGRRGSAGPEVILEALDELERSVVGTYTQKNFIVPSSSHGQQQQEELSVALGIVRSALQRSSQFPPASGLHPRPISLPAMHDDHRPLSEGTVTPRQAAAGTPGSQLRRGNNSPGRSSGALSPTLSHRPPWQTPSHKDTAVLSPISPGSARGKTGNGSGPPSPGRSAVLVAPKVTAVVPDLRNAATAADNHRRGWRDYMNQR